ncbi:uncharacterized protein LOC128202219 isoform X2 [Galleria mellonella]|uniref:Uncharacterized protein LOC128202219 isoform X2 n=1 Tax=Galleria mellonella TaxID=7137 RepID=A0ABM3N255_GALME|nr:uncharacterized protein LOC128202219 isoform X2 [Galleria mellonella]
MFTSQELKKFLEQISENAKFVKYDFVSAEKFTIQLRSTVVTDQSQEYYNQYVGKWIQKFSDYTATNWIVRNSFPKVKRMLFRKVFTCHRSGYNKSKSADRTLNVECKAKIDFKMKFINRNTIRNDAYLKDNLNMCIFINFVHSHKVRGRESYNLLKSSSDTDRIFYELFDDGYTPTMAKMYHELTLIDRHGHGSEVLMAASINPSMHHVHYVHKKWKSLDKTIGTPEELMARKKESITKLGGLMCHDNPQVIVVVTPLMRRVISECSLDIVIVESTVTNILVTFMYVPSKVGALPMACVLHTEQNEASYSQAFFAVKLLLEDECGKSFEPKTLFANNLQVQRSALEAIYPSSRVLVSNSSICCDVWEWICKDTNKIDRKKRHILMTMFDSMFRADTMETAEKYFDVLSKDEYVNATPTLLDYVNEIWGQCRHWFVDHEEVKDKHIDLSVRLFKELIVSKCKPFNIGAMVDVATNILDNYFRQILLAYVKEQDVFKMYTKFFKMCKSVLELDFKRIGANEYRMQLESPASKSKYIKFRTDTWCCDCVYGKRGHFCEHLTSIINSMESKLKIADLGEDEKSFIVTIAGDDKCVKELKFENVATEIIHEHGESIDDECDDQSIKSSKDNDVYCYEEIKIEKLENTDPLNDDDRNDEQNSGLTADSEARSVDGQSELHRNYGKALRALNEEFRRLNKLFKENANTSNLNTVQRLARELSKIRPIERWIVDETLLHD